MVHSLSITTADGTPFPCSALEIAADRDTWCWRWRASVIGEALELAEQQQEIMLTIDGLTWSGLVEGATLTRRHGVASTILSGRSRSALLATPYVTPRSRTETNTRTAVQLATDELYDTGWTLDWQTVDWLVPGGAFSYSRLSPMGSLRRIAETVGACIRTDPQDSVLVVYPRYTVSPWGLGSATPDVTIPGDLLLELSVRWRPEALIRGVWVSGRTVGVAGRVYRAGTDGAPYGEMVVDELITHEDAARERGRQIIAAGGKRADVQLVLPLSTADTGLILPGQVVSVTAPETVGYADAVTINASRNKILQTVVVERIDETP